MNPDRRALLEAFSRARSSSERRAILRRLRAMTLEETPPPRKGTDDKDPPRAAPPIPLPERRTEEGYPLHLNDEGSQCRLAFPEGIARNLRGDWFIVDGENRMTDIRVPFRWESCAPDPDFSRRGMNDRVRDFLRLLSIWGPVPEEIRTHLEALGRGETPLPLERTILSGESDGRRIAVHLGPNGTGEIVADALRYRSTDPDHYLRMFHGQERPARLVYLAAQSWNRDMAYLVEELGYSPQEALSYSRQLSANLNVILGAAFLQLGLSVSSGLSHEEALVGLLDFGGQVDALQGEDLSWTETVSRLLPDPGRSLQPNPIADSMSEGERREAWRRARDRYPYRWAP